MRYTMESWLRQLEVAAAGVAAVTLIELFARRRRPRTQLLGRCLLGGATAVAYANLVPRAYWGVRSGAAFASLPPVSAARRHLASSLPFEPAAIGALTGWLLRRAA